jgi:DNA adenine methylase
MTHQKLPRIVRHVIVPPIKCQGIKTKLVKFILSNIRWNGNGRWIEPFLGSGVVLFNVQPRYALINDINPHIIRLYRSIYDGSLSPHEIKTHLVTEGRKLLLEGEDYYYRVRERFNKTGDPLDFLFLNRSCFNGVMRFNSKGYFNVPFCRKVNRFRQAYVTKIVNQVLQIRRIMQGKKWEFRTGDWRECLAHVTTDDFVYLAPPILEGIQIITSNGRRTMLRHWQKSLRNCPAVLHYPCGRRTNIVRINISPIIGKDWWKGPSLISIMLAQLKISETQWRRPY